jgi:hypothetical protein
LLGANFSIFPRSPEEVNLSRFFDLVLCGYQMHQITFPSRAKGENKKKKKKKKEKVPSTHFPIHPKSHPQPSHQLCQEQH